jgi:dihydroneopterin aldolase
MKTEADTVLVRGLELSACIGVTEAERRTPQRLTVSLVMEPTAGFEDVEGNLEKTVNYSAVCRLIRALAGTGHRQLLEGMALEIANAILGQFACAAVEVELRKYVLPDTEYVAVRIVRRRQ